MISEDSLDVLANYDKNREMVDAFLKLKRHMLEDKPREKLTQTLIDRQCFYVPFDTFIRTIHGEKIRKELEPYYGKTGCTLTKKLCIPLKTVNNEFLGLVLHEPDIQAKYIYPVRGGFFKVHYIQSDRNAIKNALSLGYIGIVEGVFDDLSLSTYGVPTAALSGPSIERKTAAILDTIPVKLIFSDEDVAGRKMYQKCRDAFTGTVICVSMPTKDIDEYLREQKNIDNLLKVLDYNKSIGWLNTYIKL